jgi:hypothetical protein
MGIASKHWAMLPGYGKLVVTEQAVFWGFDPDPDEQL